VAFSRSVAIVTESASQRHGGNDSSPLCECCTDLEAAADRLRTLAPRGHAATRPGQGLQIESDPRVDDRQHVLGIELPELQVGPRGNAS
jgi:hypothetical protein